MVKVVFSLVLSSLVLFIPCQIGEVGMCEPPNGAALTVPSIPGLGVSVTVTSKTVPPTVIASTGFLEVANLATATGVATDALRAKTTPMPLLDSLVRNRPSIWGNKGFFFLLGLVYIALLGLFIKQILGSLGRKP